MLEACYGHDKCLYLLIQSGVDVNMVNMMGHAALMYAACDGYNKCIDLFVTSSKS